MRIFGSVACFFVLAASSGQSAGDVPKVGTTSQTVTAPAVTTPAAGSVSQGVLALSSFAPSSRPQGGVVTLAGTNLASVNAVRFIDSSGSPWPAQTWSYDKATKYLKVVVPPIPHTGYKIGISSLFGSSTSSATLQVFQVPVPTPTPSAKEKLKKAFTKILEVHRTHGWLTAGGVQGLKTRLSAGEFADLGQALDAEQSVMVAEAEDAVGGPISDSVILVALRTGKSIKSVAMSWRHCHSVMQGIGGAAQSSTVSIGSPPRNEGNVLGACAGGARYHSHILPSGISNAVAIQTAIRNGTSPGAIPGHQHTEYGFATGDVYYAPISNDPWYDETLHAIVVGAEWLADHRQTVFSGVKIIGYSVGIAIACAISVPTTAGGGCAVAAWAGGGLIAKEVARIAVDEEVVTVPGVSKETVLAGIDAIPT